MSKASSVAKQNRYFDFNFNGDGNYLGVGFVMH